MEDSKATYPKVELSDLPLQPLVQVLPGKFPIVALGKTDYEGTVSTSGNLRPKYAELVKKSKCNICQAGLDNERHITNALKAVKGQGLKLIVRKGIGPFDVTSVAELSKVNPNDVTWTEKSENIRKYISLLLEERQKQLDNGEPDILDDLIGFAFCDEPKASMAWGNARFAQIVCELYGQYGVGKTPLIYSNLLGDLTTGGSEDSRENDLNKYAGGLNSFVNDVEGYEKITDYEDYVNLMNDSLTPSLLSFDVYPFRSVEKEEKKSMRHFFASLIFYCNRKKTTGMDFWSTVLCRRVWWYKDNQWYDKSQKKVIQSALNDTKYPSLGRMRFAAFISICYGASGIAYWDFVDPNYDAESVKFTPERFTNSPVTCTGEESPVLRTVLGVNIEIITLTDIIRGAELRETVVSKMPPRLAGTTLPGLKVMDQNNGFGLIQSITDTTTEGPGAGFVLSSWEFDNGFYLLVASMDSEGTQTAKFTIKPSSLTDYRDIDNGVPNQWIGLADSLRPQTIDLSFPPGGLKMFRVRYSMSIIP